MIIVRIRKIRLDIDKSPHWSPQDLEGTSSSLNPTIISFDIASEWDGGLSSKCRAIGCIILTSYTSFIIISHLGPAETTISLHYGVSIRLAPEAARAGPRLIKHTGLVFFVQDTQSRISKRPSFWHGAFRTGRDLQKLRMQK